MKTRSFGDKFPAVARIRAAQRADLERRKVADRAERAATAAAGAALQKFARERAKRAERDFARDFIAAVRLCDKAAERASRPFNAKMLALFPAMPSTKWSAYDSRGREGRARRSSQRQGLRAVAS